LKDGLEIRARLFQFVLPNRTSLLPPNYSWARARPGQANFSRACTQLIGPGLNIFQIAYDGLGWVWNKVQGWLEKTSSAGGKEVLIKTSSGNSYIHNGVF
jgi:hypothetical protein